MIRYAVCMKAIYIAVPLSIGYNGVKIISTGGCSLVKLSRFCSRKRQMKTALMWHEDLEHGLLRNAYGTVSAMKIVPFGDSSGGTYKKLIFQDFYTFVPVK